MDREDELKMMLKFKRALEKFPLDARRRILSWLAEALVDEATAKGLAPFEGTGPQKVVGGSQT